MATLIISVQNNLGTIGGSIGNFTQSVVTAIVSSGSPIAVIILPTLGYRISSVVPSRPVSNLVILSNIFTFTVVNVNESDTIFIEVTMLQEPIASKAINPNPIDGATDVSVSRGIGWANGLNSFSSDVYFGIDSTPDNSEFMTSTTGSSYNPGTLLYNTKYYWKINSVNIFGTITEGDIWNFTTESLPLPPPPPPPPLSVPGDPVLLTPSDNATNQPLDTILSWEDGVGDPSTSYRLLLREWLTHLTITSNLNYIGTTFNTDLQYDTEYEWFIWGINAAGQGGGVSRRFTTESQPIITYCLTTTTYDLGGVIKQAGCLLPGGAWEGKRQGESCARTGVSADDIFEIRAVADIGYTIGSWSSTVAGIFVLANGTPVVDDYYDGESIAYIKMPSGDATISVGFIGDEINFTFGVDSGFGMISNSEGGDVSNGETIKSFSTISTDVLFTATADPGWEIEKWTVNGVNDFTSGTTLNVFTIGGSNFDVLVFFIEIDEEECIKYTLAVTIEGRGSVSIPNRDYCETREFILTPQPSNGYCFKEWIYSDTTITQSGMSLEFDMARNRTITAVFERIGGYVEDDFSLFYCSSSVNRANTIDFDYTNSNAEGEFHFRATFYSDAEKTETLFFASSLLDNKRWFYNDGSFKQIPTDGVTIINNETMDIVYSPEVLSSGLSETKREEFYLVCGVRYYVDIEAHRSTSDVLSLVKSISLIVDCDDVDSFYRSKDNDKNNWICSGQGNSDLLVTGDIGQSLFPAVNSNHFGIFNIVWQSRRNNTNIIYGAMWDSDNDLLYSSGQGLYDTKIFVDGFSPIVIEDYSGSFYVSSYINTKLRYYICPIEIFSTCTTAAVITGELTEKLCYPGQNTRLSSTIDDIIVRVYEEDTDDNIVINKDKVIPITTKTNIRLDISGTSALYAVRLRDSNSSGWSDWINIDTALYETEGIDTTLDAYKISDSRIIVPWTLDRINGVRRICCQLLTLYGISPTICIDIFMNIDIIKYTFEFFKDGNIVPSYNGLPVISPIRDLNTGEIIGDNDGTTATTIDFKVLFSEDVIINGLYNGVEYDHGDFTFNMVQQGIDDIWGGVLTKDDNKTFSGSFKIYEQDGVFNRDGNAFIQVITSNSLGNTICLSDISDPYNLMQNSNDAGRYHDLVPEEIFNQYKTSQIGKALDTTNFKQYYRVDDDNFRFGNPDFFRNDKQG